MKQIKELKIGLPDATVKNTYKGDEPAPKKVEPEILADGTKVWPKVERRKVRPGRERSQCCGLGLGAGRGRLVRRWKEEAGLITFACRLSAASPARRRRHRRNCLCAAPSSYDDKHPGY